MDRERLQRRRHLAARLGLTVLLATTVLAASPMLAPVKAQQAVARSYSIPAQSLSSALLRFGQVSGLQIFFDERVTAGLQSAAISGPLTNEAALAGILTGSGLSFRFTNPGTVTILASGQPSGAASSDGSVMLGRITLQGGIGAEFSPNEDFTTPGAVANVDRAILDRVPQTSTGDLLRGVTGVVAGDNRNSGGFQPNIRGAQGQGRVKVTVDGSEGSSPANRGYGGTSDTTFVDPDFIAGYTVSKGPTIDGGGAIGGTIRMRTFAADDIIRDDRTWGLRFKASIGNNAEDGTGSIGDCISNNATLCTNNPAVFTAGADRFAGIPGHDYSTSLVGAWRPNDRWDFVLGMARRESGNYAAGTNGYTVDLVQPGTFNAPGDEIHGSYKSSDSLMFKGRFLPVAGHELTFGFNRYRNLYADRRTFGPGDASLDIRYPKASSLDQKRYTLSWRWNPEEKTWLDLKTEAWLVRTDEQRTNFSQSGKGSNRGIRISNRSEIALPWTRAILTIGGQYRRETMQWTDRIGGSDGLSLDRQALYGLHAALELPLLDWLTFNAGIRKDWYDTVRVKSASNSTATTLNMTRPSGGNGSAYNLGFVIEPMDGLQIHARYSKGWRAPSLLESLPNTQGAGWVFPGTIIAVPRPETSRNLELGINYAGNDVFRDGDTLGLKLGYFDNRYKDYIAGTIFPASKNLSSLRYRGVEASARYDTGRFYVQYGATRYIERQGCGFRAISLPIDCMQLSPANGFEIYSIFAPAKMKQDLTIGGRFFEEKLDLGLTVSRYEATRIHSFVTNNTTSGNLTLVDLFASFAIDDSTKVSGSISNLTDEFYYDPGTQHFASVPGPGRTIRLSLTKDF